MGPLVEFTDRLPGNEELCCVEFNGSEKRIQHLREAGGKRRAPNIYFPGVHSINTTSCHELYTSQRGRREGGVGFDLCGHPVPHIPSPPSWWDSSRGDRLEAGWGRESEGCKGNARNQPCPWLLQFLLGRTDASLRMRKLWRFLPALCSCPLLYKPCANLLFLLGGYNEKNLNMVGAPARVGTRDPEPARSGDPPCLLPAPLPAKHPAQPATATHTQRSRASRCCKGNTRPFARSIPRCFSSLGRKSLRALLGECQCPGGTS